MLQLPRLAAACPCLQKDQAYHMSAQLSTKEKEEELLKMQQKYGVDAEQHPQKQKAAV